MQGAIPSAHNQEVATEVRVYKLTEKVVESSLVGRKRSRKATGHSQWIDLEARLQKRLGTKVTIQPRGPGGKIVIHYFSAQDLDGVVETLLS